MPVSHTLPSNIDEHLLVNQFSSKNTQIFAYLIAGPNKPSLPIMNSLESIKSGRNEVKSSRDNFE